MSGGEHVAGYRVLIAEGNMDYSEENHNELVN